MKALRILTLNILLLTMHLASLAQVANWTFDGTLAGTGSSTTVVTNAALSSAITTGGYNGNLYFGEGGWPAGGYDATTYLEFSVAPNAGHTMTLTPIAMNTRRSTTGTAAGSGPTTWSLRSSVDAFASDLGSGTLTLNSGPTTTVNLPVSFINLSTKTTFRLYGYNAVVTTGGLSRFVYDNIGIAGSTTLPVTIESFRAVRSKQAVQLSAVMGDMNDLQSVFVQRSADGNVFATIASMNISGQSLSYTDYLNQTTGADLYYRLQLVTKDGGISYSSVQKITTDAANIMSVQSLRGTAGGTITFTLQAPAADQYYFYLYTMNGNKVGVQTQGVATGTQTISLSGALTRAGIYILQVQHGAEKLSTKFLIP